MSPFPPGLPDDLDDDTAIAANDWAALRALDHLDTHWERPGWTPGRRSYHWMVTFDDHDEVRDHVTRCQEIVPGPGFDLVEAGSVHLTLGRVGFVDEVGLDVAMSVVSEAERHDPRPAAFDLRFGPLTASRGAVRFSVAPWTPLLALHAHVAEATRRVLGEGCSLDTASFRPHVSIAYAHTRVPAGDLVEILGRHRARVGPSVRVGSASLVELARVERSYRYRVLARLALDGRARLR